jgi:hypothetical protein
MIFAFIVDVSLHFIICSSLGVPLHRSGGGEATGGVGQKAHW